MMFVSEALHKGQLEDTLAHCRMQGKQNTSNARASQGQDMVDN